jgi:hypothetical protein
MANLRLISRSPTSIHGPSSASLRSIIKWCVTPSTVWDAGTDVYGQAYVVQPIAMNLDPQQTCLVTSQYSQCLQLMCLTHTPISTVSQSPTGSPSSKDLFVILSAFVPQNLTYVDRTSINDLVSVSIHHTTSARSPCLSPFLFLPLSAAASSDTRSRTQHPPPQSKTPRLQRASTL